jgi:hypothetical protein
MPEAQLGFGRENLRKFCIGSRLAVAPDDFL